MVVYSLLKKVFVSGSGFLYTPVLRNCDILVVTEELKKGVKEGCPPENFRIVKNVEFEFKYDVTVKED